MNMACVASKIYIPLPLAFFIFSLYWECFGPFSKRNRMFLNICVEQTFVYSPYGLFTLTDTDIEAVSPTNVNTDADADNFTNIDNDTNLH